MTSFRLSNLCVRRTWTLILKAVYNPASIDSGITITGPTFTKATRKKNSALSNFLILLGYFYVYNSICMREARANIYNNKLKQKEIKHDWNGLGVWTEKDRIFWVDYKTQC